MSTVDELFWYCDRRTGTDTYPDESGYIMEVQGGSNMTGTDCV